MGPGEAPGAVEDGEGAVGVFVDPDSGLDVVVTVGRDLQVASPVAHRVVVRDDAFLLNAEDVVRAPAKGTKADPSASGGVAKRRSGR